MDVVPSQAASASTPVTISPAPPPPDPGTAQFAIPSAAPAAAATPEPLAATAATPGAPPNASVETASFHAAVGAVFNGSQIDVSFRVAHDPDQVVIVYRNAQTGEVVNQIPSEAIIQLAEFFQREATGALVDQGV